MTWQEGDCPHAYLYYGDKDLLIDSYPALLNYLKLWNISESGVADDCANAMAIYSGLADDSRHSGIFLREYDI